RITTTTLGSIGTALVVLGVVFAPISTGDTALRMARLIAVDYVNMDQKKVLNRVLISLPIFFIAYTLTQINFDVIWRYFAWFNQVIAVFALWTVAVFARRSRFLPLFAIPAIIMSFVVVLFILISPQGFSLDYNLSLIIASIVVAIISYFNFRLIRRK
ncbi:MAG: carbon starvation CstA 5TM domain-containing protein, partial [Rikenellaceae bacterium]